MENRIRCKNQYYLWAREKDRQGKGCQAVCLSTGHSRTSSSDCYRNRWQQPQQREKARKGSEANELAEFKRVDGDTFYQSRSARGPSGSPTEYRGTNCRVFNFQTGTANYFASGVLVHNCDLRARHLWLVNEGMRRVEQCSLDPEYCDLQAAAWWIWGACQWIGSGWCSGKGPHKLPGGKVGVERKIPNLANGGKGVHAPTSLVKEQFRALSERLRGVRRVCGDWKRVVTPAVTTQNGLTAILLDSPYALAERRRDLYREDRDIADEVRAWAIKNGNNPLLRIALCCYTGEPMPAGWTEFRWKANGGYGNQSDNRARENAGKEVVWFSPHCLRFQGTLFGEVV